MNERDLRDAVLRAVLSEFARRGEAFVPVNSSNRHCHLCQADVERLFGAGHRLTPMRPLGQPGQFACEERVTIETEKGKLALRVVGPARKETQIELSFTDAVKLGLQPPVRMSGELDGSPGCILVNGSARVSVPRGVIIAARHLHLAPDEAEAFGLRDGDVVALEIEGQRAAVLENVIVRSGPGHQMEAHIDKDEANACGLTDGRLCRVRRATRAAAAPAPIAAASPAPALRTYAAPAAPAPKPKLPDTFWDLTGERKRLITEDEVKRAAERGIKRIRYSKDAILTPLARDAAWERHIELACAQD